MRLEGSLGAFTLSDLLGLLAGTRKTGALRLTRSTGAGAVYLRDGLLTGATAASERQSLVRRLIGSGALDDDAIGLAVQRALTETDAGVGTVLLAEDSVDRALLAAAATEQTVDAIFELMLWEHGDFSFDIDAANPDDVGISHPVDRVLAEAEARLVAWRGIDPAVTDLSVVLQMPVVLPGEPALNRDEWALLALVDGVRPLGDIVELTGCGRFAVVTTISALVTRGLLESHDRRGDHVATVLRRQALLAQVEGEVELRRVTAPPSIVPIDSVSEVPAPAGVPLPPVPPPTVAELRPVADVAPPQSSATEATTAEPLDDDAIDRSLMLRLIAGVRGL